MPFKAADLDVSTGNALLRRQSFFATDIDEIILGCVEPSADEANFERICRIPG